MSALWFSSLFEQRIGHLPSLNLPYLFASFPTILAAILTKNLLLIVLVGIASFALINILSKNRQALPDGSACLFLDASCRIEPVTYALRVRCSTN